MKALIGGVVFGLGVVAAVLAQSQTPAPPGDSLSALTAEVRLLRQTVERGMQAQTQVQGLTVYLSAQQSRLVQVSTRLDGLRRDVDAAARESSQMSDRVSAAQQDLGGSLDPVERKQVQSALETFKTDAARAAARENQARSREAEVASELQTELARWTELIARLEQATRP